MNDQQRIRIIMLGVAGVFLAGGVFAWFSYNNEKQSQEFAETPVAPRVRATVKKPADTTVAAAPSDNGTAPTLKPADDATGATAPGSKPVVEAPVAPVAAKPGVTPPTPPTPPAPIAQQPEVKPAVAITPLVKPAPTAAVTKPAVALQPLPGKPGLPAAPLKPVVAVQPAVPVMPVRPVPLAVKPTATAIAQTLPVANPFPFNPRAQATPIAIPVPMNAGAAVEAAAPVKPGVVPATLRSAASEVARKEAGRKDPMQVLTALLPWPTRKLTDKDKVSAGEVPPPPPDLKDATGKLASKINDKLVPPPPPNAPNITDLDLDNLPLPPSKPLIGDKMTVVSIIDDKAIVSFPKAITRANKWPKSITLAAGEQFDSIRVVRVSPDGVTIEEDGERSLKTLPNIK